MHQIQVRQETDTSNPRPLCETCGDRIGVYEPIWLELPDGTITPTSLLALRHDGGDPGGGIYYHQGCLAPDRIPAGERR